jgi:superfamily II DNA/RNA helicase
VEGYGKWQTWVFPCLTTIQKLANHVALLVPSAEADLDKHEKDLERLKIAMPEMWKELYERRDSLINYANINFCGKWMVLKKLLRLWYSNGDKVLVFSHSVRLLRMLQMLFKSTTSYNVSYLDGSLSYEERQKAVDEYNSDAAQFVFLISTKAGGVGLNITSANKVVVVDPNWNPSYDLQAQDRAYRIGQTRDVDVFRLVSAGTVEEIVYARQIYKQQQANIGYTASVERRYFKGVQDQKDMKGEIFGLANIFAPQSENIVLREIVNNTNIAETRAGVEIRGLDMEASQEDDDAEIDGNPLLGDDRRADAAMSQLAAEIIDAPAGRRNAALAATKKKKDPVQAILASVNVQYTHENSEVIGTSKIETRISSRAQRTGDDAAYIDHTAFLNSQSQQAPPAGVVPGALADPNSASNAPEIMPLDANGKIKYRYRPPEDVRCRQFCSMAAHLGFEDDIPGFALVVEGMTQQQRRDFLDTFYAEREVMLKGE